MQSERRRVADRPLSVNLRDRGAAAQFPATRKYRTGAERALHWTNPALRYIWGPGDALMRSQLKALAKQVGLRRETVAAARMLVERQALALTNPRRARRGGRILCYHSVGQPSSGTNDVRADAFRAQLDWALKAGYEFVPAAEIARGRGEPNQLAITFDDAWSSVLTAAAPMLKERAIPWTVFVVTDWSSHPWAWAQERFIHWRDLARIGSFGGEIGSHSVTHPDFAKLSSEQISDELARSRDIIHKELGFAPTQFAIPYGQSMNWPEAAHAAALAAGYEIIYAQAEETRPPGTVGRTFVTQFDDLRLFRAALHGAFDHWEEWV
jgi:peptidoglycan/xylan/chitin deacetylase (PgdA/CDA1 family)